MTAPDPEDQKLLTLARGARGRVGAPVGAAVRDTDGRTYAGASVDLPSLRLDALQVAVATAISSGAGGLEAAAVVLADGAEPDPAGVLAVAELGGAGTPVLVAGPDGVLRDTQHA